VISDRLKNTILKELKLKEFDLKDKTRAYDVPGWDSLNHIRVIVAIEKEYGIRFNVVELLRLKNVGDLQLLLDNKCKSSRKG
jgi:acyl carrier protein